MATSERIDQVAAALRLVMLDMRRCVQSGTPPDMTTLKLIEDGLFMAGGELLELKVELELADADIDRLAREMELAFESVSRAALRLEALLRLLAPGVFPQSIPITLPENVVRFSRAYRTADMTEGGQS